MMNPPAAGNTMAFTAGARQDRRTSLPAAAALSLALGMPGAAEAWDLLRMDILGFGAKESRSKRWGMLWVWLLGCLVKVEPFCPLSRGRAHWLPLVSHPQDTVQRVSEGDRKHGSSLRPHAGGFGHPCRNVSAALCFPRLSKVGFWAVLTPRVPLSSTGYLQASFINLVQIKTPWAAGTHHRGDEQMPMGEGKSKSWMEQCFLLSPRLSYSFYPPTVVYSGPSLAKII